jgi:hypothetical protein
MLATAPCGADGGDKPAPSQAPGQSEDDLTARVDALLAQAKVDAIRAPAEQAKLALARARELRGADEKERSIAIARAALALAEARVALVRERELLTSATRRAAEASARAEKARLALARTKQGVPAARPEQP